MNSKKNEQRGFGRFIGTSDTMQSIYEKISKIAPTNAPVFIKGESGTGKEICAQMIHTYSDRHAEPFIALNSASLSKDLVESTLFGHVKGAFTGAHQTRQGAIAKAQNGTLFLDEIGEMPLDLQAKLLRFCQDKTYYKLGSDTLQQSNVRLICASNKNMKHHMKNNLFREDLYYRLHVTDITMPALRQREKDVLDIAHYYLTTHAQELGKKFQGFSEQVEKILLSYPWPGNVRELQNTIHQIVALEEGTIVTAFMLPEHITKTGFVTSHKKDLPQLEALPTIPLWKVEKTAINNALRLTNGNVSKAAAILDVAPSTIYRKIKLWKNSE